MGKRERKKNRRKGDGDMKEMVVERKKSRKKERTNEKEQKTGKVEKTGKK